LHEHPNIRFCSTIAAQQQGESPRAPAAQIAHSLWDKLSILQRRSGVLPSAPTCDILVLDRSVDVVSPIIHEWTYEALVHDLIELNGNVYKHNVEMEDGKVETKEAVLDETDPVFTDLRHLHFADALVKISEKADDFGQKNSAAKLRRNDSGEQREGKSKPLSTRQMRRVMESLPQYRDAVAKLSVHVALAEGLNKALKERNLKELGKLEQDVVFGQARGKDVVNEFQREECYGTKLDRLRLLMCYAATHPEKFDSKACMSWASAARLQAEEVEAAVLKLELLGARVRKHSHAGLSSFSFSNRRRNPKQLGRERGADGEQWELGRFMPQAYDRAKALAEGTLPSDIFPRLGALGSSEGVEEAGTESSAHSATGASLRTANKASSWSSWAKKGECALTIAFHSPEVELTLSFLPLRLASANAVGPDETRCGGSTARRLPTARTAKGDWFCSLRAAPHTPRSAPHTSFPASLGAMFCSAPHRLILHLPSRVTWPVCSAGLRGESSHAKSRIICGTRHAASLPQGLGPSRFTFFR
jgi:syntaxin-binding protein 1